MYKIFKALLICAIFSSCANVKETKTVKITNFQSHLAKNYSKLAEFETKIFDWRDAKFYSKRAAKALAGKNIEPTNLKERKIPAKFVKEIESAREALLKIKTKANMAKHPKTLASAQSNFDCWLEEREENWQFEQIQKCKMAFVFEHNKIAKEKFNHEIHIEGNSHNSFFNISSAVICPCHSRDMVSITKFLQNNKKFNKIEIHGHTDSTGSKKFNQKLSLARAEAARDFLVSRGIDAKKITIFAHGSDLQLEKTSNNVSNQLNRRVKVTFE